MSWEAVIVIHVAGDRIDPDRLLAMHSPENATSYRKGDIDRTGRARSLSGLKLDLGSVTSKDALEATVLRHLREHFRLYTEVVADGGRSSLGIGVMIPPTEPRTITLTPDLLAALLDVGMTVHISAYPCIDDEPDDK